MPIPNKKFVLTDHFLEPYKTKQVDWGFNGLGQVVYARTYAATLEDGTVEKWWQTVKRVVEGCYNTQAWHCEKNSLPFSYAKAQRSAQTMFDLMFNFKFLPPGRGLQHMGRESVEARGAGVLLNCGFVSTKNIDKDFTYPFIYMMDFSMLGVGVGSDTRGAGKVTPFPVTKGDAYFEVPDSREGWVQSLEIILSAYLCGGTLPRFDYSKIRPAGTPLKTMGGYASGPEPLIELHADLIKLLDSVVNIPITAETIVDIHNMIGRCVVSGANRRSAQIMLSEEDSEEFLNLKNPAINKNKIESYRWASNNSIFAKSGMSYDFCASYTKKNGEPGFMWLDNARHFGRIKDGFGDWDLGTEGCNPCGEQSLEDGECCNLVEMYANRHSSLDEFRETAKYAYLYAKTVTLIPTHNPRVNAVMGRNRRIGMSISGVVQGISKFGYRPFFNELDKLYKYSRALDIQYSRWLCIPTSIKITTVKPSGTTSILTGSNPGMHFPHSKYYIRRVRVQKTSPLLKPLKAAGVPWEPSVQKDDTIVFSFPVCEDHFEASKEDVSIWEQMNLAADLQYYWSDNMVSCTVSFKESEQDDIVRALRMFESRLKSVSFLPLDCSSYAQAPYETITKSEYEKMLSKIKSIDFGTINVHDTEEKFCDGESCVL